MLEAFRIDNVLCKKPEQAFSVENSGNKIKFGFLLPSAIHEIFDGVSKDMLKHISYSQYNIITYANAHLKNRFFQPEQTTVANCLVLQDVYDRETLASSQNIVLTTQNVKITAYCQDENRRPMHDVDAPGLSHSLLNDAFDFAQAMQVKDGHAPFSIVNTGYLNKKLVYVEREKFVRYAQQQDFPILCQTGQGDGSHVVVKKPQDAYVEEMQAICTCPTRNKLAYINWRQAMCDRYGHHPLGSNELGKLADIMNRSPCDKNDETVASRFSLFKKYTRT